MRNEEARLMTREDKHDKTKTRELSREAPQKSK